MVLVCAIIFLFVCFICLMLWYVDPSLMLGVNKSTLSLPQLDWGEKIMEGS